MAVTISGDGSVTGISIEATDIEDGTITAAKLADGTVTAAKLEDGTVTAAKLSSDIEFGATTIDDDNTATYGDGDYFVSSTNVAYRYLNDGTSSAWYEVGAKQFGVGIYPKDSIAKGSETAFYINQDNELYGIGRNQYGQLGDGTTTDKTEWTLIDIDDAEKVFCAGTFTFVVKLDGTLWGTGHNTSGQLGLGHTSDRSSFTEVTSITDVDDVAVANTATLVLKSNGSVWATGNNPFGQLGLGDTTARSSFTQTVSTGGAIGIEIDNYASHYINSDGAVYGAGYNFYGQIGDGTTTDRTSWTASNITSGASKIIKGNCFLYCHIIKEDGSLWATGYNAVGTLGIGDTTDRSSFTQVISSGVSEVLSGYRSTAIIKTDGSVLVTGSNEYGQLGLGDTTDRSSFTTTSITSGAAACSFGGSFDSAGIFVLKDDDTIVSAGSNTYYELGDETNTDRTSFGSTTVTDAVGEYAGNNTKTVSELT